MTTQFLNCFEYLFYNFKDYIISAKGTGDGCVAKRRFIDAITNFKNQPVFSITPKKRILVKSQTSFYK